MLISMFNISHIIESGGILLVGFIIFAESGLLVGFFLPGDTLLFPAGFFAAQGKLSLAWLLVVVILAAIAGYEVGYHIGHRWGKALFKKEDGIIFRKEYLIKSQIFYEKHGGKTVLLSRFVPIIRTFAPIVAGIGDMSKKRFTTFNAVGSVIWCTSVVLLGYYFGKRIPNIDKYLLPAIGLAVIFSFSPTVLHLLTDKKIRAKVLSKLGSKKS